MNDKLDTLLNKLGEAADKWLDELQTNPIRTAIKILVVLWAIKQARKLIRDIR